jgi:hypothetical protein
MANDLITVGLLETNADYKAYLPTIVNTLPFIRTGKATVSKPWTKYFMEFLDRWIWKKLERMLKIGIS